MATRSAGNEKSLGHGQKRQREDEPDFSNPTTLVTFIVGAEPNTEKFMVHKEVACFGSPVLDAALDRTSIEGDVLKYTMDSTTPRAFRLLVQWLYSRKLKVLQLRTLSESPTTTHQARVEAAQSEDESLAELWVLGRELCIPDLQNHVLDKIFAIYRFRSRIPFTTYHYIFKNTSGWCGLARYTIDFCLRYLEPACLEKHQIHFPRKLLVTLTMSFTKQRDLRVESGSAVLEDILPATYYESNNNDVILAANEEPEGIFE
ncbi:uncharacterized protein LY89DRAFT_728927 [Mollisia scopiformis]|uniref:BTB domain-containing protein n=1 Tax=Mollisia scopiformis TaxID=149040 RepID=A0A194XRY7_MOLSC|nr:uncharacterized protein LY89DRAFT_728927 [Mollisia scopiformis]KUJ22814.1 hypothetical protein LY89DRAFT_728927 [Mollisia scopiformis]